MKERVLTENQKSFLSHLLGDAKGDFKAAKKLAGYADTVSVAEITRSLKDELRELAMDALTMASIKASFELEDILTNPSKAGAGNALKAAESILAKVGVKAPDELGIKIPAGGLFIMPAKNRKEEKEEENV